VKDVGLNKGGYTINLKITESLRDFKLILSRATLGPLLDSKVRTLEKDNSNISAQVEHSTYDIINLPLHGQLGVHKIVRRTFLVY
jgi:hypothetical protein